MSHFHQLCSAALLLALATATAAAQQRTSPDSTRKAQCFQIDIDEVHGPIKRILVDYQRRAFMVQQWGVPRTRYVITANCTPGKDGALSCGIECEGGEATMSIRRDGVLALDAHRFALYAEVHSALPAPQDVDAYTLSGRYNLAPVAEQRCADETDASQRPEADLRKGEFEPRVKELEQSLVDLGYLARRPSWYFTGQTHAAVAEFQRSIGSKPTGVADPETIRKLRMIAAVRGGSC